MLARRGRMLACEFLVLADDEAVHRELAVLPFGAAHPGGAPSRSHRIEVVRAPGGYAIREDGQPGGVADGPGAAARHVRERVHALALAAMDGHACLHAGCATWRGRGILVAGAGRSGKTTLMARLLLDGALVQGDDTVLLRDGHAVALPRRFGLRRGTLDLIPELSPLTPAWAAGARPDGYHVLALDPAELGRPWRVAPVPVDAVFFLEPAHGRLSRALACPRYRMARHLMSQSIAPAGGVRAWIREIATLVARAECYLLEIGELDSAIRAVNEVLTRDAAVPGWTGAAAHAGG